MKILRKLPSFIYLVVESPVFGYVWWLIPVSGRYKDAAGYFEFRARLSYVVRPSVQTSKQATTTTKNRKPKQTPKQTPLNKARKSRVVSGLSNPNVGDWGVHINRDTI